ncbi:MAG: hypothetical protein HY254_13405 [Burkholderiales bacterium]|nr:hypothetical protein [Burkholderiales bacterium]
MNQNNKGDVKNKTGTDTPVDQQDPEGPDFSSIKPADKESKKTAHQSPANVDFSKL